MSFRDSDSQLQVPDAFLDLYRDPRRQRLSLPPNELYARYEFCEDLAQAMVETAQLHSHNGVVSEEAVLLRCHAGLSQADIGLTAPEARWAVSRLAELLGWPQLEWPQEPDSAD